jgi:hypothetical protein
VNDGGAVNLNLGGSRKGDKVVRWKQRARTSSSSTPRLTPPCPPPLPLPTCLFAANYCSCMSNCKYFEDSSIHGMDIDRLAIARIPYCIRNGKAGWGAAVATLGDSRDFRGWTTPWEKLHRQGESDFVWCVYVCVLDARVCVRACG